MDVGLAFRAPGRAESTGVDVPGFDELEAALRGGAARLVALTDAVTGAVPRLLDGSDPTHTVHVRVGEDGLPRDIALEADWRQRLPDADLGSAVMLAYRDAAELRLELWSEAFDQVSAEQGVLGPTGDPWPGWPASDGGPRGRPDVSRPGVSRPGVSRPGGASPAQVAAASRAVTKPARPPRPVWDLVAEAVRVADAAWAALPRSQPAATGAPPLPTDASPAPRGVGRAASGRVVVTVTQAALGGCVVEDAWAERQNPSTVAAAVRDAFGAAADDLRRARASHLPGDTTALAAELAEAARSRR
jgi:hypothetical protein